MKVFLSWSGEQSKQVALVLRDWLPKVIQQLRPWMSSEDIPKGTAWFAELDRELADGSYSVVCLTPDNLDRPWLNFEAGALAGKAGEKRVCTALFGVSNASVEGPLSLFQSTALTVRDDVLKLMQTLNGGLGAQALAAEDLREAFEVRWPALQRRLEDVAAPGSADQDSVQRSDRSILEEVLERVRDLRPRARGFYATANLDPTSDSVVLADGSIVTVGDFVENPAVGAGRVLAIDASKHGMHFMAVEIFGPPTVESRLVRASQPFHGWSLVG